MLYAVTFYYHTAIVLEVEAKNEGQAYLQAQALELDELENQGYDLQAAGHMIEEV